MCEEQRTKAGGTEPLIEACWRERAEAIAGQGRRVLALATKPMKPQHAVLEFADVEGGLLLLGLVGLIDPPRPEAIVSVVDCRADSIRVKMITGDHAGTAAATGRQIGLQNPDQVLTGADLDRLDDAALALAVLKADVFARTRRSTSSGWSWRCSRRA